MKFKPEYLKKMAIEILKGFTATDEEAVLGTESFVRAEMRDQLVMKFLFSGRW